jgi:hypothetical protein
MWKNIRSRQPAKHLSDVDIPDASWKPDFDITDRYQSYANELMRLSILGIAGYGFLIKEIYMSPNRHIFNLRNQENYLLFGAIFLGLSLSFVLAHRFYSTQCLYYQIVIMRSLKRLGNHHWTDEEKKTEEHFLKKFRKTQTKLSLISHYIIYCSAIFFALGFLFVFIVFYGAIRSIG